MMAYEDLGDSSEMIPGYGLTLECHHCKVQWGG